MVAGGEPRLGHLDVSQVAPRGVDEGGDLGAFERDGAALGVVFVVAGGVRGVFDDLLEVASERLDPLSCPITFALELTSDRVAIRCVHPLLR